MRKHHTAVILILLLLLILLIGCSRRDEREDPYRIAVITMMQGGEFWGSLKNGARNARSDTGVVLEFMAPINESEYEAQIAYVEEAITQQFDAIVLSPSHSGKLYDVVKKAKENGIKVVLADTGLEASTADFFITADYLKVGKEMAQHAFSLFEEEMPIRALVIGSLPNSTSMNSIIKGLSTAFSMREGASIVHSTYSFSDEAIGRKITEQSLENDTSINMIFALEENSAHGVVNALPHNREVKVIAFGTTHFEIQLLEEEVIDALVVINTFNLGYRSIKAAIDLIKNKKPVEMMVEHALVTKESMFSEEHQRLLFQTIQ